ncbi:MAG: rhodanese-like domain-containing protein [Acidimicrobiales bacterium]
MPETTLLQPSSSTLAARHFAWRLRFETDPYDVNAKLDPDNPEFDPEVVLVDTRGPAAFHRRHIPGAISLPLDRMTPAALSDLDRSKHYITYAADPACNGATKGAMEMAGAGLIVQEMLGGIEYWERSGYPTTSSAQDPASDDRTGDPALVHQA